MNEKIMKEKINKAINENFKKEFNMQNAHNAVLFSNILQLLESEDDEDIKWINKHKNDIEYNLPIILKYPEDFTQEGFTYCDTEDIKEMLNIPKDVTNILKHVKEVGEENIEDL